MSSQAVFIDDCISMLAFWWLFKIKMYSHGIGERKIELYSCAQSEKSRLNYVLSDNCTISLALIKYDLKDYHRNVYKKRV